MWVGSRGAQAVAEELRPGWRSLHAQMERCVVAQVTRHGAEAAGSSAKRWVARSLRRAQHAGLVGQKRACRTAQCAGSCSGRPRIERPRAPRALGRMRPASWCPATALQPTKRTQLTSGPRKMRRGCPGARNPGPLAAAAAVGRRATVAASHTGSCAGLPCCSPDHPHHHVGMPTPSTAPHIALCKRARGRHRRLRPRAPAPYCGIQPPSQTRSPRGTLSVCSPHPSLRISQGQRGRWSARDRAATAACQVGAARGGKPSPRQRAPATDEGKACKPVAGGLQAGSSVAVVWGPPFAAERTRPAPTRTPPFAPPCSPHLHPRRLRIGALSGSQPVIWDAPEAQLTRRPRHGAPGWRLAGPAAPARLVPLVCARRGMRQSRGQEVSKSHVWWGGWPG